MKNKSFLWGLWIWAMAFCLTFGAIGGLVTGFDFTVSLYALALWCAGINLVWVCILQLHIGRWVKWMVLGSLAIAAVIFWRLDINPIVETANSLEVLLHRISARYDLGYGWGTIQWSEKLPETTMLWSLGLLAMPGSLTAVWAISRKKATIWAILPPILPFFACLVVTDTVPAIGCLLLLAVGIFQLILTGSLRRQEEIQGKRLVAMTLIPVLLTSFLLFRVVPRQGYQPISPGYTQLLMNWLEDILPWELPGETEELNPDKPGGESYSTAAVSLSTLGDRDLRHQTVMWVSATAPGILYVREQGYDSYDGLQWRSSGHSSGIDTGWGTEGKWETVKIKTVYREPNLFHPGNPGPESLTLPYEFGRFPNDKGKREYSFQWQTEPGGGVLSEEVRSQCLSLPEDTGLQAGAMVAEMLGSADGYSTREIASIIGEHVRNHAKYSLTPQKMPQGEEDFALWFLKQADKGYCVHFATAATVLLRAAGVPARYVTGYLTEVSDKHTTRVYLDQAHAWVEYFDEEKGWTILDPTPSQEESPPTEPTQSTFVPSERPTQSAPLPTETVTVPTYAPPTGTSPGEKPTEPPPAEKADLGCLLWIPGLIALAGVIWWQYRIRLECSRRRLTRGTSNQQALARWRAILHRGRILGGRPPRELKQLAEKAKFSQHMLTAEELACFDAYLLEQTRRLGEKPPVSRWLLRLFWALE